MRHYWLCERWSEVLTLLYEEGYGVILKVPWPELAARENYNELLEAQAVPIAAVAEFHAYH